MQRYDSYKDSGIQWLGQIPGHWEVSKVRTHFTQRTDKVSEMDFPPLSVSKQGIVPQLDYVAISQAEGNTRKLVRKGDFVVNSRSDRKGSCGVSPLDGSVSLINIVLEPHDIANQYIHYLFRMNDWIEDFYRHGRGIVADLWTTNYQQMKNMLMPIPPLSEQEGIVAYLDKETEKIDSFIAGKEKELALLNELKQAEIANAVTKGLHPDVPLKDSGITWLGQVPEHWEVKSLRSFIRLFTEKGYGDAQLLSVTREQGVIVRNKDDKEENHNFVPEDLSGYKHILPGDFVINKMKSWQGSYGVSAYDGIVSPAYFTCKLANVEKDYFSLAIRSKAYIPFFTQYSKGIRVGQWDLDPIALMKIPFILPPIDEQKEIVEYLDGKCANIDKMISNIEQEITQLKEYKQRLIADAVTGQIKVC